MSYVTPPLLRAATVFALALGVSSVSFAETETDAAEAVSQVKLEAFLERTAAKLDAKVEARTDAMVEDLLEAQLASLTQASEQRLALAIQRQTDERLAARMRETRQIATGERPARDEPVEARMASGSLDLPEGASSGRHRFDEPFGATPQIAVSVRPNDESRKNRRASVSLRVVRVDETGFDYEIRDPADVPKMRELTADWVAYSGGSSPPAARR